MTQESAPAVRYFYKNNPARPITVGEGEDRKEIHFAFCDRVAGQWRGVFKDEEGIIPDELIVQEGKDGGQVFEIPEGDYLKMLQKKRPEVMTQVQAVDSFKEPDQKPPAATADSTPHNAEDAESIEQVQTLEGMDGKRWAANYTELAEATGKPESELKELARGEGAPSRNNKNGHSINAWTEYLASQDA